MDVLLAIIPSNLFSTALLMICSKFLKLSSGEIFNKQGGDFNEWSIYHFSRYSLIPEGVVEEIRCFVIALNLECSGELIFMVI